MDEDYSLHLTDVGREVAEQTYEKHRFFTDRLIEAVVDPDTAERDACRIEHVISDESFRCLESRGKVKILSIAGRRPFARPPPSCGGGRDWQRSSSSMRRILTAACSSRHGLAEW